MIKLGFMQKHCLNPKTIRDWNTFPMEVVEAPSLDAFMSWVSN